MAFLVCALSPLLAGVYLASASYISWLKAVFILGYVKIALGLVKYAPQVWLNIKRKSTEGFSVEMMILDLIGGGFSLLNAIFIAINGEDGADLAGNVGVNIAGNPGKLEFGIVSGIVPGIVTCLFQSIFLIQKYVMYQPKSNGNPAELEYAPIQGINASERNPDDGLIDGEVMM